MAQTVCFFPRTDADVILDVRQKDDASQASIVVVDSKGAQKSPGLNTVLSFQGGGGIIQVQTHILDAALGVQTDADDQRATVVEV